MSTTVKERLEQYPEISFIEGISFETFFIRSAEDIPGTLQRADGKGSRTTGSRSNPINIVQLFCASLSGTAVY